MAKILLIEPDIKLGKIYKQFLEISGHQISWRLTAQTGLNNIDEFNPDIIVLEIQMPSHNGIEFLYELRSYKDWQAIPVLIHSCVPPVLKAISPMLWEDLSIVGYSYKPTTKLRDLLQSIEKVTVKL